MNHEKIETVYNLKEASEILTNRAAKHAKRLLHTSFKKIITSPIFIQKVVGMLLIVTSIVLIEHCQKAYQNEPVFGFYVILIIGIYLLFEKGNR